jgi:hypothetical protein
VRVPACPAAEHVDPGSGDFTPVRVRHDHDLRQVRERDDDQVALCLQAVDDRDGRLAFQMAEDVEAGAAGEIGKCKQ